MRSRLVFAVVASVALVSLFAVSRGHVAVDGKESSRSSTWRATSHPVAESYRSSLTAPAVSMIQSFALVRPNSLPDIIHAIRLPSGYATRGELLGVLTSETSYQSSFPDGGRLFYRGPFGNWRVSQRTGVDDFDHEAHADQLLSAMGEAGVSLATTFRTKDDKFRLSQLLDSSRRRFLISQLEVEWSVLAYLAFLPSEDSWENRLGESISYDLIGQRLLGDRLGEGACYGSHRLYAIASMLNADDQFRFLSRQTRRQLRGYLGEASAALVANQTPGGGWDSRWWVGANENPSVKELVYHTGHHLEWLSIASPDCRPADDVLVLAIRFMVEAMANQSPSEIARNYCPYSHGVRALCGLLEIDPTTIRGE